MVFIARRLRARGFMVQAERPGTPVVAGTVYVSPLTTDLTKVGLRAARAVLSETTCPNADGSVTSTVRTEMVIFDLSVEAVPLEPIAPFGCTDGVPDRVVLPAGFARAVRGLARDWRGRLRPQRQLAGLLTRAGWPTLPVSSTKALPYNRLGMVLGGGRTVTVGFTATACGESAVPVTRVESVRLPARRAA